MALYVQLVKLSREGTTRIREIAADFAKVRSFNESLGGQFVYVVACFGAYDFVALVDYPDEVAALKGAAYAAAQGNATIETLPARPIEDFFRIMSELPQ